MLREDADCPFNYLADITCVDWYPAEPRFEVVYHLLSLPKKERVRLKVRLGWRRVPRCSQRFRSGLQPIISSAKFSTCSEFDSAGHPYLRADSDAGRLGRTSAAQGLPGGGIPLDSP